MADIRNEYYQTLRNEDKEIYKILFESSINSSKQFNGFIQKKLNGQYIIQKQHKEKINENNIYK